MKKTNILLGMALCLGLASCNEFDLPNPPGQSNPEVPVFNSDNLEIKQAAETLDLQAAKEAGTKVTLAEIEKIVDFPEAYTLLIEADFATAADFSDAVTIATEINDETLVQLEPSDLNKLICNNFTKDPKDITLHARLAAYATLGATKQRLGGADYYYATDYTYLTIPFAPEKVIESEYYLLHRAVGATSWDVTSALPFTHTSDGSPYDNPVFSIKVDVEAPGMEWAVIPGSSFDAANTDGILGVADNESMTGALVGGEEIVPGVIADASPYTITINAEADTYAVAFAYECLWVPGGANGNNFSRALKLFTTDYITYSGTMMLNTSWYLTAQDSNKGTVFMLDGEQTESPAGTFTGKLDMRTTNNGGKVMSASAGLYYISANLGSLTYKLVEIPQISLIGAFNGWDTATAVDLTPNARKTTWTVKDVEMTAGEYKFCVSHAWTYSFGGSADDIVQNGGNLVLDEAGTYDFTLDFTKQPNTLKIVKK